MNQDIPSPGGSTADPIRLFFEMSRDDNPRLYDDLIRFNKGTKRVNRLRFLAHEGLMVQDWPTNGRAPVSLPLTAAQFSPSVQQPSLVVSGDEAKQVGAIFNHPNDTEED